MNRLTFLLPVLLLMVVSCEKEKKKSNTNEIVFDGITSTDEFGDLIFRDTTDWKFTDNWTDKENSLFIEKRDQTGNMENFNYSIVTYPNPCNSIFRMDIAIPDSSRFTFRLVDKDFNILSSHDSIFSGTIEVRLEDYNISNEIVRMYYKILIDNCELRGHGDIKIE